MVEAVDECVFCAIVAGEADAEIVFETDGYLCIRDQYPVTEGHALLFPKQHRESLTEVDWDSLTTVLEEAITTIRAETTPDGMNVGINDGAAAGQTIPHVHWHLIPRYEGDVDDPTGGVRGVIPDRQQYDRA